MNLPEFLDDSEIVVVNVIKVNLPLPDGTDKEYIGIKSIANGNTIFNLTGEDLILRRQGPRSTDFLLYQAGNSELPNSQEKTYYIVPKETKESLPDRKDLLSHTGYIEPSDDLMFKEIRGLE